MSARPGGLRCAVADHPADLLADDPAVQYRLGRSGDRLRRGRRLVLGRRERPRLAQGGDAACHPVLPSGRMTTRSSRPTARDRHVQLAADERLRRADGHRRRSGAIHPAGGTSLALRLRSGLTAGDLQPVVLRYQSDLPTVPLNLTAASATPNMGVLIWVLGSARAIPRNYFHTVIDDAQLDWLNSVRTTPTWSPRRCARSTPPRLCHRVRRHQRRPAQGTGHERALFVPRRPVAGQRRTRCGSCSGA